jgi:hypothetical protein
MTRPLSSVRKIIRQASCSAGAFFSALWIVAANAGPIEERFDRYVIDPTPPLPMLEKAVADIDGDGKKDAVIGLGVPKGSSRGSGIVWYQFPRSGNPADRWVRHTIVASGKAYESAAAFDVNSDGAVDVVASIDGEVHWFENPGSAAANDAWPVHVVGSGAGENNIALGDLDGDGRTDIATPSSIFFQDSPNEWTPVRFNASFNWLKLSHDGAFRGMALLDIGSGKGAINIISNSSSDHMLAWFENPREHGGDARNDAWIEHDFGLNYDCTAVPDICRDGDVANMGAGDLNEDGRMDIVTVQSEGLPGMPPPPGGMIWWEAPQERRSGVWVKHTVDATFESAHNIAIADMNGDGSLDLVAAEQEQSSQGRVAVYYNDGSGNFTGQVLSHGSGHELQVADMDGDGGLDILNAGHGVYRNPTPIELYVNRKFRSARLGAGSTTF